MNSTLVIFDFDGTLADTWRDIATALNRTLQEAGLPVASAGDVRSWIGDGVVRLLERAVPEEARRAQPIPDLVERFLAHYDRCLLETTVLYPGISECLAQLAGCRLAILSNKLSSYLDRQVIGLGLAGRFAAVVGGDAAPAKKPDPVVVRHVVAQVGVEPDELWMVGDSAIDIATGRGAGARTIGCAWGLRGRSELEGAGAEFIVDDAREIPTLILSPCGGAEKSRATP
jgi:phosphoglycolate phosphatase